ncbi:MAG: exo-alpha-sialidase [Nitrosomonadales bacterium]|nr:exo-alpha-sialidase [Nitrosomonadales bacterium]
MNKFTHHNRSLHRALLLALVAAAFGAAFYKAAQRPAAASFQMPVIAQQTVPQTPDPRSHFVSSRQNIHTHAASLVELGDGRIRAFWFAGSREGAEDVEIRTAVFDPVKNQWSPEHSIANRAGTQHELQRYVKKLGNPVAQRMPDGTLRLFYVTVSVGGWAGSSLTTMTSNDNGTTWSKPRRLVTSPFLNISTLVKGTPFLYGDGTLGLPVYHEFIGKFGELLRIDGDGNILDKRRLSSGNTTLQPVLLIDSPQHALALMRYSGAGSKRVIATSTDDAGQHWSTPGQTVLANPDAALTGTSLPGGPMLAVLNDIEQGRDALSLVLSTDRGASWKTILQLEDQRGSSSDPARFVKTAAEQALASDSGIADAMPYALSAQSHKCAAQQCAFEFSYPYLIQTRSGDVHLVYTWNRSFIKHVQFTRAWLDQQIAKATDGAPH